VTVIENGAVVDCAPIAVVKQVDNPNIVAATNQRLGSCRLTVSHPSRLAYRYSPLWVSLFDQPIPALSSTGTRQSGDQVSMLGSRKHLALIRRAM
jgi:hypothetical protein